MSDLEFFLIRTLPNKRRSLKVALRYGNRSKWRYQNVVKHLSIMDASDKEAMLSICRARDLSEGRFQDSDKRDVFIAQKDGNTFLLAPMKTGTAYHINIFNRRQCAIQEVIPVNRDDVSQYKMIDKFVISVAKGIFLAAPRRLMFIEYSDLRNPEIIKWEINPLLGYTTEDQFVLVRGADE